MDAHADANVAFMGDTPLSIAARHNRKRLVQWEKKKQEVFPWSPCLSSFRILLNFKETNVNHRNDQGGTALHFASAGKSVNEFDRRTSTCVVD